VKQDRVQRHPWIDRELACQLKIYCAARRATETSVFNAALRDYFADAKDATLVMRRLDRNDRATAVVRQTVELLSETFIGFVQSYFTNTPEMPEAQRKLGATFARRRLDELLDAAARRYAGGGRLLDVLPRDQVADDAELAAAARAAGGERSTPP
jgi:DNA invertase Pin-like site-specific DNA recombinase